MPDQAERGQIVKYEGPSSADALYRLLTRDAHLPENVVAQVKSLGITSITDFRS